MAKTNRKKDFAEKETDAILDELEGRIVNIYSQAYKELREKFEKHTEKFAGKDVVMRQKLQSGKINEKDYLNWRQGQLFIENRLDQLIKELGSDLVNANKIATSVSNGYMPEAYALNFNYETYDIEQNTQIDTSFTLYSRESVEQLVKQKEITLPKRKVDVPKDQRWNVRHLNNEITQGILQGKSIPEISKSLRNVTDMNRKASVRNARTMMTGAQNSGRMDAYARADSLGIKIEKEWMATLDNRTRDSHQRLDGERVPWKKVFSNGLMYPGDPSGDPAEVYNCRCTMVPFYPDYAEGSDRITYLEWAGKHEEATKVKTTIAPFTPAKTIKEAEKYAQQFMGYNGKVSYNGIDLEYANTCNRVLNDIHANYEVGGLSELQKINFRKKIFQNATTADACYRWGSGGLYINPNYYKNKKAFENHKKEIDGLMKTILDNGEKLLSNNAGTKKEEYINALLNTKRQCVSQSYDFAEASIVHECGHMLDDKIFFNKLRKDFDLSKSRLEYGGNISGYAVTDTKEYIAESFTAWWYGESEKCDPKIISVFEGMLKK